MIETDELLIGERGEPSRLIGLRTSQALVSAIDEQARLLNYTRSALIEQILQEWVQEAQRKRASRKKR